MAALPSRSILDGTSSPTTSAMKTALGSLYDYLNGLFSSTGTVADARSALGISATNTPYTPTGDLASTDVQAALTELDTEKVSRTSTTGSAKIPAGTTAQQDSTPSPGYFRFNVTLNRAEIANNSNVYTGLGGATGAGGDDVFHENSTTVTTNYTITTNKNAMSAGPITVNAGITVTVPAGSTWTVV